MSEFYEILRSRVIEIGTSRNSLATELKLFVDQELRDARLNLSWDMDTIRYQAEQQVKNAADLGVQAVLHLHPSVSWRTYLIHPHAVR